jgi:hypothetical protein
MTLWHTWLGYFGLLIGLVSGSFIGWSIFRSSVIGLIGGMIIAAIINFAIPGKASCLQTAKGIEILTAYSLHCAAK